VTRHRTGRRISHRDPNPIRVLLADDHTITRQCVRALLDAHRDMVVEAEAADGLDSIRIAEDRCSDLVVMDISMPNMNGLEATRRIIESNPRTAVVVLSMRQDESSVLHSLRAGAKGYVLKNSSQADLITAIRAVSRGDSFLTQKLSHVLEGGQKRQRELPGTDKFNECLTHREREVFQLVAEGRSNKEVANMLYMSPTTVQVHRRHIFEKLGFHRLSQMMLYAIREKVIG
jgi:two-component system response regulator NreC